MSTLQQRLKQKGWSDAEVARVSNVFGKKELKRGKFVYWFSLVVAIVGNGILSVVLVPFLLTLKGFFLYAIIIMIGIAFGSLFNLLLKDIETADEKQHVIAWVFIPAIAIINIYFMTDMANYLIKLLKLTNPLQDPFFVSIVYVFSFSIPYLIAMARRQMERSEVPRTSYSYPPISQS
ncbi:MAG: hypothetical protein Q7J54_03880 [Candidatus Woesearchaeota archaeon]|nr:hypothetical protein [Candidatus Woesearchaeota archaeon]